MKDEREDALSKPFTLEDFDAHVRKLGFALRDAPALVRYLENRHPEGPFRVRIPVGMISKPVEPGKAVEILIEPYLRIRPYAMVLEDETAASFNVYSFQIGNVHTPGSGEPIPLDTCAVRYFAGAANPEKLLDVQSWGADLEMTPGDSCRVRVENVGPVRRAFRGILWAKCAVYP